MEDKKKDENEAEVIVVFIRSPFGLMVGILSEEKEEEKKEEKREEKREEKDG